MNRDYFYAALTARSFHEGGDVDEYLTEIFRFAPQRRAVVGGKEDELKRFRAALIAKGYEEREGEYRTSVGRVVVP